MEAEDIYHALTQNEWEKVRDICNQHPEGPFLKMSSTGESVLQKALYAGYVELVLALLDDADKRFLEPHAFENKLLGDVNIIENTPLHVAATQDSCFSAAVKICRSADHLLFAQNKWGEVPIFFAVRYGQLKMFEFLNRKIIKAVSNEEVRLSLFYRVSNKLGSYTILHVAINYEHFELALHIANTIPSLIREKDNNQMTALHLLAMNSAAFGNQNWKWLQLLLPSPFRHISDEISHELATDRKGEDGAGKRNDIMPSEDAADHEVEIEDGAAGSSFTMTIPSWPYWSKIKREYRRYQAALRLGSILVENDTEWIDKLGTIVVANTEVNLGEFNSGLASAEDLNNGDEKSVEPPTPSVEPPTPSTPSVEPPTPSVEPPTPLILATKYGCLDIARQIIKKHPQTVEQVGREYGSILHLAIKYRRIEIFDAVEKMQMQMRRLVRLSDRDGNTILHMVALNTTKAKLQDNDETPNTTQVNGKNGSATSTNSTHKAKSLRLWDAEEISNESRSPAFILQDDLLLFERVEDILKTHYHKSSNRALETADQLFAAKKEPLRGEAQEWMKRTAENCSIVAVLIATVAFAAAYTVPGGSNNDGSPVLLNQAFFVVFTVTDVLSLASTLTAVVVFLSILCSSYRLEDFKETLPKSLMFGISCLIFSLTMMMLAFAATIILMIKNRQQWTRIALYAVAFLPVTVLVATYLPFYVPLMRTFYYTVDKVKSILPNFTCPKMEKRFSRFHVHKSSLSNTKKPTTWVDPSIQV